MTLLQDEMNFDAWREDKGEHTGSIPQCMLMSRIQQTTKQGAKYARSSFYEKRMLDGRRKRGLALDKGH
jgi:hypothetical protein